MAHGFVESAQGFANPLSAVSGLASGGPSSAQARDLIGGAVDFGRLNIRGINRGIGFDSPMAIVVAGLLLVAAFFFAARRG